MKNLNNTNNYSLSPYLQYIPKLPTPYSLLPTPYSLLPNRSAITTELPHSTLPQMPVFP
ncbi:MAG: hypothetical protein F6K55_45695 [Moorea sp. SIO4A3]|nr:hypothetical protein [Moorena sp. SIO4A3]